MVPKLKSNKFPPVDGIWENLQDGEDFQRRPIVFYQLFLKIIFIIINFLTYNFVDCLSTVLIPCSFVSLFHLFSDIQLFFLLEIYSRYLLYILINLQIRLIN